MQEPINILEHEDVRKHLARLRSAHHQMLRAPKPHPSPLLRARPAPVLDFSARERPAVAVPVAVPMPVPAQQTQAQDFVPVTIPLVPEILDAFKTPDWQTRVNSALLTAVRKGEI